jgi:hypothetical protein
VEFGQQVLELGTQYGAVVGQHPEPLVQATWPAPQEPPPLLVTHCPLELQPVALVEQHWIAPELLRQYPEFGQQLLEFGTQYGADVEQQPDPSLQVTCPAPQDCAQTGPPPQSMPMKSAIAKNLDARVLDTNPCMFLFSLRTPPLPRRRSHSLSGARGVRAPLLLALLGFH